MSSNDRDTLTAVTALTDINDMSGALGRGPARDSLLLGKYRVETTLGFGGMGLVIRALNVTLDERVAIKLLRDDVELDDGHVERFLREAKAAVRLKSEHVARIRDVGLLENSRPYMVMELLEGLDLGRVLVDQGTVWPQRAVDLILQACDAIAEAHAIGIVHRDIKPTNLFVTRRRDGSELLKVLDFGISKAQSGVELSLTQTSSLLGTPAYMSPEQMRSAKSVDTRTDIWSLGAVLYELVEGRQPFEAKNVAELCVIVSTEPPAPMVTAPQLSPVIMRCLAKAVDERFQDVGELVCALEPFASDPAEARQQVARILRVLGKPVPARTDPTPVPRSSAPRIGGGEVQRGSVPQLGSGPIRRGSVPQLGSGPVPHVPGSDDAGAVPQQADNELHKGFPPPRTMPREATYVPPRRVSLWLVLVLLLIFAIGIAGGFYVITSGILDAYI